MTTVELVLLITVITTIAACAVAVIRTVRSDGLGHRPSPRSHEPWEVQGWGDPLRR